MNAKLMKEEIKEYVKTAALNNECLWESLEEIFRRDGF